MDGRLDDDFNPYEAPRAPLRPGGASPRADAGRSISIDHDLTDDDLRRLPDFDAFYDPMPFLGLVPQWAFLVAFAAAAGFLFAWLKIGSVPLAVAGGLAIAVASPFGLAGMAADNRRRAHEAGSCEARTLTISPEGLRVTLGSRLPAPYASVGEAVHAWGEIRKIEERGDYFFFWKRGRARVVLPRRAFRTPAEADSFFWSASRWHAEAT